MDGHWQDLPDHSKGDQHYHSVMSLQHRLGRLNENTARGRRGPVGGRASVGALILKQEASSPLHIHALGDAYQGIGTEDREGQHPLEHLQEHQ
eukprot:scaffold39650_cov32-Prasinocladus_malaysianus.AAC.2